MFRCDLCEYEIDVPHSWIKHYNTDKHEKNYSMNKCKYECVKCCSVFKKESDLKKHKEKCPLKGQEKMNMKLKKIKNKKNNLNLKEVNDNDLIIKQVQDPCKMINKFQDEISTLKNENKLIIDKLENKIIYLEKENKSIIEKLEN